MIATAARAFAGWAGAVGAGALAFDIARTGHGGAGEGLRWTVLTPGGPPFQCVALGAVAAFVLACVRARRPAWTVAVVSAWVALQTGLALDAGWPRVFAQPLWAAAIAVGLVAVAAVYDALADAGYRFGKFLVIGPLVSGLWVAATPAALFGGEATGRLLHEFLLNAFLGLVIGDGCAFGVEVAELGIDVR